MSTKAPENGHDQRAELTKQAIGDIVRARIVDRRFRQTAIARNSGISRTHLRSLLRGEKQMSVFIFLELSEALALMMRASCFDPSSIVATSSCATMPNSKFHGEGGAMATNGFRQSPLNLVASSRRRRRFCRNEFYREFYRGGKFVVASNL